MEEGYASAYTDAEQEVETTSISVVGVNGGEGYSDGVNLDGDAAVGKRRVSGSVGEVGRERARKTA